MVEVKYLTVRCQDASSGKSFYLLGIVNILNETEFRSGIVTAPELGCAVSLAP